MNYRIINWTDGTSTFQGLNGETITCDTKTATKLLKLHEQLRAIEVKVDNSKKGQMFSMAQQDNTGDF